MGSGFSIKQSGNFQHLENFIARVSGDKLFEILDDYGQIGVSRLAAATPEDSGVTAASWSYYVDRGVGQSSITFTNDHMDDNGQTPVVILLQYGHGTGTGGYVQGHDFINPAIQAVFDNLRDDIWKAVVAA